MIRNLIILALALTLAAPAAAQTTATNAAMTDFKAAVDRFVAVVTTPAPTPVTVAPPAVTPTPTPVAFSCSLDLVAATNAAVSGSTIVVSGICPPVTINGKMFVPAVTINATAATFPNGGVYIVNSTGVHWTGGTYGPNLADNATGFEADNSHDISMIKGTFLNLDFGVFIESSDHVKVLHNEIKGIRNDSIRFFNSQFGDISYNAIIGGALPPGSVNHADAIQSASPYGKCSDLNVTFNVITGNTQGITAFTDAHQNNGFQRLNFSDNYIAVSYPQALAMYSATDSTAKRNILITLPTADHTAAFNFPGSLGLSRNDQTFVDLR